MNLPERCVRSGKDRTAGFELGRGVCLQEPRKPALLVSLGATANVVWGGGCCLLVSGEQAIGVARGRSGLAHGGALSWRSPSQSSFVEAACPTLWILVMWFSWKFYLPSVLRLPIKNSLKNASP